MIKNENISLIELASRYPNLTITVSYNDLLEVFRTVYHEENLKNVQAVEKEESEVLLTEEEVKEALNTSHSTLWRWHRNQYLMHIKIGNKNRYRYSDVMKIKNNK